SKPEMVPQASRSVGHGSCGTIFFSYQKGKPDSPGSPLFYFNFIIALPLFSWYGELLPHRLRQHTPAPREAYFPHPLSGVLPLPVWTELVPASLSEAGLSVPYPLCRP